MQKLILFSLLSILSAQSWANKGASRSLASIKHAKELLGKKYENSIVSNYENHPNLAENIHGKVKFNLPKDFKKKSKQVAKSIIKEAAHHGFDPYFIMAVIAGESSFNPVAVGSVGEIGLMQIRPSTAKWIAKKINFEWKGKESLKDPVTNIKLGTAYLAWLREKFNNHGQLYLAAYNLGPSSVKNAVLKDVWPKDYPKHVMKRYLAFYKEI